MTTKKEAAKKSFRGYSIVELLVAAIILSIAITAIIAVIRKGRELEIIDKHRRQARSVITNLLETKYDDRNFLALAVAPYDSTTRIPLDTSYTPDLMANLRRQVMVGQWPINIGTGSTTIPLVIIKVSVNWAELDGNQDTIIITKRITQAR